VEGKLSLMRSSNPHLKYRVAQRKQFLMRPLSKEVGAPDENQGVLTKQTDRRSTRVRKSLEWEYCIIGHVN
jgi:hypothetical protein